MFYPLIANRWQLSFKAIYLWSFWVCYPRVTGWLYQLRHIVALADHRSSVFLGYYFGDRSVVYPAITGADSVGGNTEISTLSMGGLGVGAVYLGIGFIQHERVLAIGHQLATERGHQPLRLEAKPSFANIVVWKLVYETEQKFYIDAVRPGVLSERILTGRIWAGNSTDKLNLARDFLWLDPRSQQAEDVQRFGRFSSGYLGLDPQNSMGIVDIRYSLLPHQIAPLWGIQLSETRGNGQHAHYFTRREKRSESLNVLMGMLIE